MVNNFSAGILGGAMAVIAFAVAAHRYISASYFSRVFREQGAMTFSDC